jgi:DNA-binding HxlR family transcriptional regulator
MVRLRYGDLKSVFLEQMRVAMGDTGRRSFLDDASILNDSSECNHKGVCIQNLEGAVYSATSAFMKDDLVGARNILDRTEVLIRGDTSPCQDKGCSKTAVETLHRLQVLLQIYEELARRIGPEMELKRAVNKDTHSHTAEEIQTVLDPLANAWRIKVLAALKRGDHSLTELGHALELKTGHLQFHLRALVKAGFIGLDRRRHRYLLTERGALALSCAEEMVSKLSVPSSDETA